MLDVDGIILYDVQDESGRTSDERPFPFLPTVNPFDFAKQLQSVADDRVPPRVTYIATGNCSVNELENRLRSMDAAYEAIVLV